MAKPRLSSLASESERSNAEHVQEYQLAICRLITPKSSSPTSSTTPIPTRGYQMLPMVGLGGSAGSIGALQTFFSAMPPDTGMVFVVILHLSSEHESTLAEVLQRGDRNAGRAGRRRRERSSRITST